MPEGASLTRAQRRSLLEGWIEEVDRALATSNPSDIDLDGLSHTVAELLFLLAAHGPSYGLTAEVRAVLGRAAAPRWPPKENGVNPSDRVACAAAVASAELVSPAPQVGVETGQ